MFNPDGTRNYGYSRGDLDDVCKEFSPCVGWLIVFSPSASDTPIAGSGVRYDLTDFLLDERYGSKQQITVSQATLDPLFEQPYDCEGPGGLEPTPGVCQPYREARAVLPGSTGSTLPPDNGAGMGQSEVPPMVVSYALTSVMDGSNPVIVTEPPASLDESSTGATQPECVLFPSGIFEDC